MSNTVIKAQNISKKFGGFQALKNLDLALEKGNIIGLIGPNGAGKTTLLKTMLGLLKREGKLEVLGFDPYKERNKILQRVCFVSDVGVLPLWASSIQLLNLTAELHSKFNIEKAKGYLRKTDIDLNAKVKSLSKGMKAQLHLAIILSVDVEIMILDEPTLGLDILHRKAFLNSLANEFYDETKTIVVSTHQVEEIEEILTHLIFIQQGRINLDVSMKEFRQIFHELEIPGDRLDEAKALNPISTRRTSAKDIFLFEGQEREILEGFGSVSSPTIADVFVAKMGQA